MTKQLCMSSSKLEIVSVPIKVVITFHFCPEQCHKSKEEHYGLVSSVVSSTTDPWLKNAFCCVSKYRG